MHSLPFSIIFGMASSRDHYHHKQRLFTTESVVVIAVNILLAIAASVALVRLIAHNLAQRETIQLLDAEVDETRARVDRVRESFSQYFDPQQTKAIMRQQSRRVEAGQAHIIFNKPDRTLTPVDSSIDNSVDRAIDLDASSPSALDLETTPVLEFESDAGGDEVTEGNPVNLNAGANADTDEAVDGRSAGITATSANPDRVIRPVQPVQRVEPVERNVPELFQPTHSNRLFLGQENSPSPDTSPDNLNPDNLRQGRTGR